MEYEDRKTIYHYCKISSKVAQFLLICKKNSGEDFLCISNDLNFCSDLSTFSCNPPAAAKQIDSQCLIE